MFTVNLNRSLPTVIGAYRYIYVFYWNLVFTEKEKKKWNILLLLFLVFLPLCCTASNIYYMEFNLRHNVCMGREEQFFYDFNNIFDSTYGPVLAR